MYLDFQFDVQKAIIIGEGYEMAVLSIIKR